MTECPHCLAHTVPRTSLLFACIAVPGRCDACHGAVVPQRLSWLGIFLGMTHFVACCSALMLALVRQHWWPLAVYAALAVPLWIAAAWRPLQAVAEREVRASRRNVLILVSLVLALVLFGAYALRDV
jgi:hypothetical protein